MLLAAAGWGCLAVFGIGALYSVAIVGITGGPNHGEHPFTVAMVHAGIFGWYARHWPWSTWGIYAGLLAATLVVAILAMGVRAYLQPRGIWAWRGGLAVLHAGMGWILLKGSP